MDKKCNVCGQRPFPGIATVYYRWSDPGEEEIGWRVYYCLTHYRNVVYKAFGPADDERLRGEPGNCAICGEGAWETNGQLRVFIYPPKQEAQSFTATLCDSHMTDYTSTIRRIGFELVDREADVARGRIVAWDIYRPSS